MNYPVPEEVETVAIIGAGSVGASWAALMLAHRLHVRIYDPGEGAWEKARSLVAQAWPSLVGLGTAKQKCFDEDALTFCASIAEVAAGADIILENGPERPELKRNLMIETDAVAPAHVLILSSTGGIPASELQEPCVRPERIVVFHPFNPAHLVPLVEVVPGKATSEAAVDAAMAFARFLGKHPIRLRAEMVGHMTNRLQFALVREAVRCLLNGSASASEIDAAVRYGLAPRWMLMGGIQTLQLAGGVEGMRGILEHAGDAIEQWWDPGDAIHLTSDVRDALVKASAELSQECGPEEWMAWRDAQLLSLLRLQAQAAEKQPRKERGI